MMHIQVKEMWAYTTSGKSPVTRTYATIRGLPSFAVSLVVITRVISDIMYANMVMDMGDEMRARVNRKTIRFTRVLVSLVLVLGSLTGMLVWFIKPVQAATFVVNSTLDTGDDNPGDSSCDDGSGVCTLRAAIEEANALAGSHVINFNISGEGPHTITPETELPVITKTLTIDGITQSGSSCGNLVDNLPGTNTPHDLRIIISGEELDPGAAVLQIHSDANNSVIRGLVINEIPPFGAALVSFGADELIVECNYIGTNQAGTASAVEDPLGTAGFILGSTDGSVTAQNNLISGLSVAISIFDGDVNFVPSTIEGNLLGTTANGLGDLSNDVGVVNTGAYSEIAHNVIGASTGGMFINANVSISVIDNYIGVGIDGTTDLHTGLYGILLESTPGDAVIAGNLVQNQEYGVVMLAASSWWNGYSSITDNTIRDNGMGIWLDASCTVIEGVSITSNAIHNNNESGVVIREVPPECDDGNTSIYNITIGNSSIETTDNNAANEIYNNGQDGIRLYQSDAGNIDRVSIVGNSIYNNANLGINLGRSDDQDGTMNIDAGANPLNDNQITQPTIFPNNYLNYPTINTLEITGNEISIDYDFIANQPEETLGDVYSILGYRLDFYLNDSENSLGYGEGKTHLGSTIVGDSVSSETISFTSPVPLDDYTNVSATATFIFNPFVPDITFHNEQNQNMLLAQAARVWSFFNPVVHAQGFPEGALLGSTSEYSPFVSYASSPIDPIDPDDNPSSEQGLADTGANWVIVLLFATILVGAGSILLRKNIKI